MDYINLTAAVNFFIYFFLKTLIKMGSGFKFNLIKSLKGSHKYFQELNKPALRTIIQSTYYYFSQKNK